MKTLVIFSILTLVTFSSYSQTNDTKGLLNNTETRKEVFNIILNDHGYMTEFMQAMHGSQHAMMMMKENNQMEGQAGNMEMKNEHQMMDSGNMMGMMKNNPEMMQKMMGNMMEMCKQDTSMRSKMANMMVKQPEMMQMCMQKMKDNGMMGADGKMKMMKTESQAKNEGQNHQH
jgi:hypothetical protein